MFNNQMLMQMFQQMMGSNPQMQQMFRMAQQMANNNPQQAMQNIMKQKGLTMEQATSEFTKLGKQLGFNEQDLQNQLNQIIQEQNKK